MIMKRKLIILSILCAFVFNANSVSAIYYYENIGQFSEENPHLRQNTLDEAQLLKVYILKYKENINALYNEYGTEYSSVMNEVNLDIDTMVWAINQLKMSRLSDSQAQDVLTQIVDKIKLVNSRMKNYLETRQQNYLDQVRLKKQRYDFLSKQIRLLVNTMVWDFTQYYNAQDSLSRNDKKLIYALSDLQKITYELQEFEQKSYTNIDSMKSDIQEIIQKIQSQFKLVLELVKNVS